jgi:hypothetical protein
MTYLNIPSASGQLIFLTDIQGWTINLVEMQLKRRHTSPRPIYNIDMYNLALIARPYQSNMNLWNKIWTESFNDNSGSSIYSRLKTVFPVNIYNKPKTSGYEYKGDFSFSPIIPYLEANVDPVSPMTANNMPYSAVSPTWYSEYLIWKASVFPLYPFLITSTIVEHEHFGPVFANKIGFSCSGTGTIKDVEIAVNFEGGKSFQSAIIPIDNVPTTNDYKRGYRRANFSDCMVTANLASDTLTFFQDAQYLFDPQTVRMVEISLDITQTFDKTFTCTSKGDDSKGTKYMALNDRTVTGSLKYYSKEQYLYMDETPTLTMYFGGPFLFSMPNVQWQKPSMIITPGGAGGGYIHTFEFIARAAPYASADGFKSSGVLPISEFYVLPGEE